MVGEELAGALCSELAPDGRGEVLGPAPAPLARLRGRYRFQLLVKGADRDWVLRAARRALDASSRLAEGIQASVDVAPVNML